MWIAPGRAAGIVAVVSRDVFVEYTKPDSAKANILTALARGAHVRVHGANGSLTLADVVFVNAELTHALPNP